jgi:hypothetical protein
VDDNTEKDSVLTKNQSDTARTGEQVGNDQKKDTASINDKDDNDTEAAPLTKIFMFIEVYLLVKASISDLCSKNVNTAKQVNIKLRLAPSNFIQRPLNRSLYFWIMFTIAL